MFDVLCCVFVFNINYNNFTSKYFMARNKMTTFVVKS